jgi:hypothetical protein
MSKQNKIFIVALLVSAFFPGKLFAAQLNVEAQTIFLRPGDTFETRITLDAKNEDINAVAGKLIFQSTQLTVKEIHDGASIISFWAERPSLKNNEIKFSGIIPGGYKEDGGLIFSVIFQVQNVSPENGGSIAIQNPQVLLNDGNGTETHVTSNNYDYQLNSGRTDALSLDSQSDKDLPEAFTPVLGRDSTLFDGKWFLSFATQDKKSGIDHYEIKEGYLGKFVVATSPYVLKDQSLGSKITVVAYDKVGNERTEILKATNRSSFYKDSIIYAIIGLVIVLFSRYFIQKQKV